MAKQLTDTLRLSRLAKFGFKFTHFNFVF